MTVESTLLDLVDWVLFGNVLGAVSDVESSGMPLYHELLEADGHLVVRDITSVERG